MTALQKDAELCPIVAELVSLVVITDPLPRRRTTTGKARLTP